MTELFITVGGLKAKLQAQLSLRLGFAKQASLPRRWFTSWFVHQSFLHVTSNMALFLVVALQIEEKYGFWRIALLYFLSALGGRVLEP